jgi:hypothetical protein
MKKSLSPFIPLFVASVLSVGFVCPAQGANFTPDRSVTYKSVDGVELKIGPNTGSGRTFNLPHLKTA